jgi:hypothetical protein
LTGQKDSGSGPHFFDRYEHWIMPVPFAGCWFWTGPAMAAGYGWVRKQYAHRLAYEAIHGPGSAAGLMVRHTCDISCCVNPDHLLLGTVVDNARDMRERGRSLRGERNTHAKLTYPQAVTIRILAALGVPQPVIASQFDLDQSAVSLIATGKRWGMRTMIETRKALRAWARDKPQELRDQVGLLCWQLRTLASAPNSPMVRAVVQRQTELVASWKF